MIGRDDIPFILYNNRSLGGVTAHFFRELGLDPFEVLSAERLFKRIDSKFSESRMMEVTASDLIVECEDVVYGPRDLSLCVDLVKSSSQSLLEGCGDLDWILGRGLTRNVVSELGLGSLSYVVEHASDRELEILGISAHPMLKNLMDDDLSGGGILFPLYSMDGVLINVTTRRISDVGKLKYTQSCPEIHVWGLDDISVSHPTWITEGLLDMLAINNSVSVFSSSHVRQAVSVSSAMWSIPQLLQLLKKTGQFINIFADNDAVGLRSAAVIKEFLTMHGKVVRTYVSSECKDPAEHFLELGLSWDEVHEIEITNDILDSKSDMSFNFTKYLKNRRF
jgi:hypothetical protein